MTVDSSSRGGKSSLEEAEEAAAEGAEVEVEVADVLLVELPVSSSS